MCPTNDDCTSIVQILVDGDFAFALVIFPRTGEGLPSLCPLILSASSSSAVGMIAPATSSAFRRARDPKR